MNPELVGSITAEAASPWLAGRGPSLLVGTAGAVALVTILLVLGGSGRRVKHRMRRAVRALLAGSDRRLSTSKTVAAAWTVVVTWMLLTGAIAHLAAGVAVGDMAISADYLLLLGGPFASAVIAKGIVTTRLANGTLQKSPAPEDAPLHATDLVNDDAGRTDLVDSQYTLFNLLALGITVATFVIHPELGLPAIPSGLLAVTSAAAAAYVGNKAIAGSTPQIGRVDPGTARAGQTVTLLGSYLVPTGADAPSAPTVTVDGEPAPLVGSATASAVTVRVPVSALASPAGRPATVELVSGASGSARAQTTLVVQTDALVLNLVTPSTPAPGDVVALSGRGFLDPRALDPADDGPTDPPMVVLGTDAAGATPNQEIARVSPTKASDTTLEFAMPALTVGPATRLTATVLRGGLRGGPLPLRLGASPGTTEDPGTLRPRTIDATQGLDIGMGVATVNSTARTGPAPVTFTRPPAAQAWWQDTRISLCETSEEIYSALDVSVDAAVSYGAANASDKFTLAQSCDRLGYSLYLVVRATMQSALAVATDVQLSDPARRTLEDGDFANFVRRWGDTFVSGRIVGGEFAAVLAINCSSEDARQQIRNSLSVGVEVGELSASVQNDVTRTLNQYSSQIRMTILTSRQGGVDPSPPATSDGTNAAPPAADRTDPGRTITGQEATDLLTAVRVFPSKVNSANAWPLIAQLSSYLELDLPNAPAFADYLHGSHGLDGPRTTLEAVAARRKELVGDLARVRAVLANPFGYTERADELASRLEPLRQELTTTIDELESAAQRYATAVAEAGDAARVTAPTIPARDTIKWPSRPPVASYLIRPRVGGGTLAMSVPANLKGGLVLAQTNPDDPRQVWLVPDLGPGRFSMRNAATGRYATNTGGQIAQADDGNADAAQWTLGTGWPFDGGSGFTAVFNAGAVLNAYGNQYGPGTQVGMWGFTLTDNALWTFEHIENPPTTPVVPPPVAPATPSVQEPRRSAIDSSERPFPTWSHTPGRDQCQRRGWPRRVEMTRGRLGGREAPQGDVVRAAPHQHGTAGPSWAPTTRWARPTCAAAFPRLGA